MKVDAVIGFEPGSISCYVHQPIGSRAKSTIMGCAVTKTVTDGDIAIEIFNQRIAFRVAPEQVLVRLEIAGNIIGLDGRIGITKKTSPHFVCQLAFGLPAASC